MNLTLDGTAYKLVTSAEIAKRVQKHEARMALVNANDNDDSDDNAMITSDDVSSSPSNDFSFGMPGQGETTITEATETGEALRALNEDIVDPHTKMSSIDLRTRLHDLEIDGLLVCDTLVSFGVLTEECLNFSRSMKRLKVSKDGLGRKEQVDIINGQREQQSNTNAMKNMKNMFGMGQQK